MSKNKDSGLAGFKLKQKVSFASRSTCGTGRIKNFQTEGLRGAFIEVEVDGGKGKTLKLRPSQLQAA